METTQDIDLNMNRKNDRIELETLTFGLSEMAFYIANYNKSLVEQIYLRSIINHETF